MKIFQDSLFKEAEERIRSLEIQSTTRFYTQRSRNKAVFLSSEKEFNSLSGYKVQWKDSQLQDGYQIPFTGIPYIVLGLIIKECMHGPDRKHKRRQKSKSSSKQNADHDYSSETKRKRLKKTRRLGCPASVKIRAVMYFPEYQVDSYDAANQRKIQARLLKSAFATTPGTVKKELKFFTSFPEDSDHKYHLNGEVAGVSQPIDERVAGKVRSLYIEGVQNASEMERHIETYVRKDLNVTPLSPLNRRFNPSKKDIRNHMAMAANELSRLCYMYEEDGFPHFRYSSNDQENLKCLIDEWRQVNPSDSFFLRTVEKAKKETFIFVHQTEWQRSMLRKYGQDICIMDATYKTSKYALPLFFLCVQTNVGHTICASFITSEETKDAIAEGLMKLKEWNSDSWNPRYFMTDFDEREISAIEETFPDSFVYLCSFHREQSWIRWLRETKNGVLNYQEIHQMLKNIALADSNMEFQTAVKRLKECRQWITNKKLQNWFSKQWLSHSKRWVLAFRDRTSNMRVTTTNGLERKHGDLKNNFLSQSSDNSLSSLVSIIVKKFIPDNYKSYTIDNIKAVQQYKRYHSDTPSFLLETAPFFKKHCLDRIQRCSDLTFEQLSSEIFQVKNGRNGKEYEVNLMTDHTACSCPDWHIHHLPCKHMLFIMLELHFEFKDMPSMFKANPHHIIDKDVIRMNNPCQPSSPVADLGQPASPVADLGQPASPLGDLGQPASPVADLGQPASPVADLGQPASPVADLGQPASPVADLGHPASPVADLGQPASPIANLGQPASSVANLGQPASPVADLRQPASPVVDLQQPAGPVVNHGHLKDQSFPTPTSSNTPRAQHLILTECLSHLKDLKSNLFIITDSSSLEEVCRGIKQLKDVATNFLPKDAGLVQLSTNQNRSRPNMKRKLSCNSLPFRKKYKKRSDKHVSFKEDLKQVIEIDGTFDLPVTEQQQHSASQVEPSFNDSDHPADVLEGLVPELRNNITEVRAVRDYWDKPLYRKEEEMINAVLHGKNLNEPIASVCGVILTRADIKTLDTNKSVECRVINACFTTICAIAAVGGKLIGCMDGYVVPTWIRNREEPPLLQNTIPGYKDMEMILIPVYRPGHWCLSILDIKEQTAWYFDPLYIHETRRRTGHHAECEMIRRLVKANFSRDDKTLEEQGWTFKTAWEEKNLPAQYYGNDCGIFIIMYALYKVMGSEYDFQIGDMPVLRKWLLLLLTSNYSVRSSRGDIEYVKYSPWSNFAIRGVDPMPKRWQKLHKQNPGSTSSNTSAQSDDNIDLGERKYDMRINPPKKRWSDNWQTVRESCGSYILGVNDLPELGEEEDSGPMKPPLTKEEKDKARAQRHKERVAKARNELEKYRVEKYCPTQNHRLHKTLCIIYDFINNIVLKRVLKPSKEMIFWSSILGKPSAITLSSHHMNISDSIIFNETLTDLGEIYNILIHEVSHAVLGETVDHYIQNHGPEFKKTCTMIVKGIKQNKDKQPIEIKNLPFNKDTIYFARK